MPKQLRLKFPFIAWMLELLAMIYGGDPENVRQMRGSEKESMSMECCSLGSPRRSG